jgi:superfamily II DNA helicase RecQ
MGLSAPPGSRDLERQVRDALQQMERMDAGRLELLARYLDTRECRQGIVSRYFGRELEQGCGVCDNCLAARDGSLRPAVVRETRGAAAGSEADTPLTDEQSHVLELLRAWRREKARELDLPAYIVFHDRVLYAIARACPDDLAGLAAISGVGRAKLQAHGEAVISLVRAARRG